MARIHRMTKKKLGELLVDEGLITEQQIQEVLGEQKAGGGLFGEILVRKSYVTESDIARTIARQFSIPFMSTRNYEISPEVIDMFDMEMLERHQLVPFDRFGKVLTVVIAGVLNKQVLEQIEELSGCTVQVYAGTATDVKDTLAKIAAKRASGDKDKNSAEKPKAPAKPPAKKKPDKTRLIIPSGESKPE